MKKMITENIKTLTEEECKHLEKILKYYLNKEYAEWSKQLYETDEEDKHTRRAIEKKLDTLESIMRKLDMWIE